MFQAIRNWTRPCRRAVRQLRRLRLCELAYFETLSYSQFGEDLFLEQFFTGLSSGFYVDVGAYHPFRFSNTYRFYRRGWSGINLEPNPTSFEPFARHRPRDINLQLAVSSQPGSADFVCDSAYSGILNERYPHHKRARKARQVSVQCQSLESILDRHLPAGQSIQFLSVDCEGHDAEVIKSNHWDKYRPRVVLVEDSSKESKSEVDCLLEQQGYSFHSFLTLTKVFVDSRAA